MSFFNRLGNLGLRRFENSRPLVFVKLSKIITLYRWLNLIRFFKKRIPHLANHFLFPIFKFYRCGLPKGYSFHYY
jgi:hypothetical protein